MHQTPMALIDSMFQIQNTLNTKSYDTAWIQKGKTEEFDYMMAAGDEAHEYARSLPFQWWTKDKPDRANQVTELVDAWHFVMSQFIIDHNGNVAGAAIDAERHYLHALLDDQNELAFTEKQSMKLFVASLYAHNTPFSHPVHYMKAFFLLCRRADVSLPLLNARYVAKANLNKFRVANGYKQGTYDKIWEIDGVKGEDNYFLASWVDATIAYNPDWLPTEAVVTDFLTDTYGLHKEEKAAREESNRVHPADKA